MRNGRIVDIYGTQRWYLDDELHRDENDLPAVIWEYGQHAWYSHGQCHRENDLPAVIYPNGSQSWFYHGLRHRNNDLPAIIYADGSQLWYHHGTHHRENCPAIIYADGSQEWYRHGKEINVKKWIKDNDITSAWKTWDDLTWSLFRLEFL